MYYIIIVIVQLHWACARIRFHLIRNTGVVLFFLLQKLVCYEHALKTHAYAYTHSHQHRARISESRTSTSKPAIDPNTSRATTNFIRFTYNNHEHSGQRVADRTNVLGGYHSMPTTATGRMKKTLAAPPDQRPPDTTHTLTHTLMRTSLVFL